MFSTAINSIVKVVTNPKVIAGAVALATAAVTTVYVVKHRKTSEDTTG